MKAVVWTGPRQMTFKDLPQPTPGTGEVLVKVEAVGICGSELSGYLGESSLRVPPLIMGHEFAGEIVLLGEGAKGLHVGDKVTVNPLIICGTCISCKMGLESLCAHRQIIGAHLSGAFAEYVTAPMKNCTPLPASMGSQVGSLAEPLACGVRAVGHGGVTEGSRVMVIGAGAIGLLCMTAIRQAGGVTSLVAEVNPGRLATAVEWGAEAACDARTDDPAKAARQLSAGLGVDVVIDAVGNSAARKTAVEAVRPGGTVVFLGLHEASSPVEANYLIRSEIKIAGSFAYTPADFAKAVHMLAAGEVKTTGGWIEERELSSCADSFAELVDAPGAASKITLRP